MKIGPYLNRAINSATNMKFISVFIRVKASPLPGNGTHVTKIFVWKKMIKTFKLLFIDSRR